jgi:2-polyprenyl-3-methyl-5-hydroxy-6-metoxy-1,4-benzoquinol methylase
MNESACRICGSMNLVKVLHYDKAPRNIERLLDTVEPERDQSVELDVCQCAECNHVQLPSELESNYYEDYLMTHSHAEKMKAFQKQQAEDFVENFDLKGAAVFEAGCGDGQFARILKDMGCEVVANEPSAKAREACTAKGLDTVDGYLGKNAFPTMIGRFDAFVARQVLEHVPDPNDFVSGIRELLKPGGVGLIEVPALEQAIEHSRFFDFFPDHLSYFSSTALTHLFSRNDFEVVQVRRAMDGEYNEAWVRKLQPQSLDAIQKAADSIAGAFREFLDAEGAAGRTVAIWGAGAKGVLTLAMVDTNSVAYLIDKDPVKHGRFTPVSHLQIWPPDQLLISPVDTVIITALAYKDEIVRDLKNVLMFKGKIAYLSGGRIVDESS